MSVRSGILGLLVLTSTLRTLLLGPAVELVVAPPALAGGAPAFGVRRIRGMPPTSDRQPGSVRSAAEVNEDIRALWLRAGGALSEAERREYEQLLAEWTAALRAGVIEAA